MPRPDYVLNLAPQHEFSALADWPEAQLLLLVPRSIWIAAMRQVTHVENVRLAGRFGASHGEYEWDVLEQPPGMKWLPRTVKGDAAYFGFVVTPDPMAEPLEAYGMIDIGGNSPWWYDGVMDLSPLLFQSDSVARAEGLNQADVQMAMSLEEYRNRGMLTAEPAEAEPAWRIGAQLEVKRFKEALVGLLERARAAGQSAIQAQ